VREQCQHPLLCGNGEHCLLYHGESGVGVTKGLDEVYAPREDGCRHLLLHGAGGHQILEVGGSGEILGVGGGGDFTGGGGEATGAGGDGDFTGRGGEGSSYLAAVGFHRRWR
jgi:hypothetical protein